MLRSVYNLERWSIVVITFVVVGVVVVNIHALGRGEGVGRLFKRHHCNYLLSSVLRVKTMDAEYWKDDGTQAPGRGGGVDRSLARCKCVAGVNTTLLPLLQRIS